MPKKPGSVGRVDQPLVKMPRRAALKAAALLAAAPMLPEALLRPAEADCARGTPSILAQSYAACGVGGGGAFAGFSMSPYQDLWFVGTDMGTLFRSIDRGVSWQSVPNANALFLVTNDPGTDLADLPGPGYSATANMVFHAPAGATPIFSANAGIDWHPMNGLGDAAVRFWFPDSNSPGTVYAGLTGGIAVTRDNGCTWTSLAAGHGPARGMFLDASGSEIYVGFEDGIYLSSNGGASFARQIESQNLHRFAGGRGAAGAVFVYVQEPSRGGAVFIGGPRGMAPAQIMVNGKMMPMAGCEHAAMAENDSVVYVAGMRGAPDEIGTSIYKCTDGATFTRVFCCADRGYGVDPWPTLSPSAVGLDIKYWDDGYYTFNVNQRDSSLVGGGEKAFLHLSADGGRTWQSPFCRATQTPPGPGQSWTSTGLENTSIRKLVFSAVDPQFGIACGCDHYVLITEDAGQSWRIATDKAADGSRAMFPRNACYDAVFDPEDRNTIYAALSDGHDFQHPGNFGRAGDDTFGGVYRTGDRGRSWTQLTGGDPASSASFVSIAFNPNNNLLYCGAQGSGLATVRRDGTGWTWCNTGLPSPAIVAQIQPDPATGDMYALLGSDPSENPPNWQFSGIYRCRAGETGWTPLRGNLAPPAGISVDGLMHYPTSFALMRGADGNVRALLLTDAERADAAYLATGLWQSLDFGKNWTRLWQYTHAYSVDLDPKNPNRIYLSGMWYADWGGNFGAPYNFGALYSDDCGTTFNVNKAAEIQNFLSSVTPDPNDPSKIFYTCFGAGLRHGTKP